MKGSGKAILLKEKEHIHWQMVVIILDSLLTIYFRVRVSNIG